MNSSKLWMRVTSEGTARHAVPTSRGALLCSARRAAAQRTTVRMYTSLRSVEVIAEVIGVLPPEGGPILQKLVKAVKEDVEEAQQEAQQRVEKAEQRAEKAEQRKDEAVAVMIREKDAKMVLVDAKMVLADKLHLRDKLLSRAMYSAGVRDGRSCLGTSARPTTVGNRPAASTAVILLLLRTLALHAPMHLLQPAPGHAHRVPGGPHRHRQVAARPGLDQGPGAAARPDQVPGRGGAVLGRGCEQPQRGRCGRVWVGAFS